MTIKLSEIDRFVVKGHVFPLDGIAEVLSADGVNFAPTREICAWLLPEGKRHMFREEGRELTGQERKNNDEFL